uniref:Uncharacterized protein n=1 Tax=Coccidioides posadasii RMSCC 3488 TaxID=454284 RepID=A0A0J6F7D4_COCPO|nr:hypothetical protein CPAG_05214 [Coccidioides posadasii RMSCC 3488]
MALYPIWVALNPVGQPPMPWTARIWILLPVSEFSNPMPELFDLCQSYSDDLFFDFLQNTPDLKNFSDLSMPCHANQWPTASSHRMSERSPNLLMNMDMWLIQLQTQVIEQVDRWICWHSRKATP